MSNVLHQRKHAELERLQYHNHIDADDLGKVSLENNEYLDKKKSKI
jgi:hypothetical protein